MTDAGNAIADEMTLSHSRGQSMAQDASLRQHDGSVIIDLTAPRRRRIQDDDFALLDDVTAF